MELHGEARTFTADKYLEHKETLAKIHQFGSENAVENRADELRQDEEPIQECDILAMA